MHTIDALGTQHDAGMHANNTYNEERIATDTLATNDEEFVAATLAVYNEEHVAVNTLATLAAHYEELDAVATNLAAPKNNCDKSKKIAV